VTERLVVVSHPQQVERHGPFEDLDAANAKDVQLVRDDSEVGDIRSDAVYLRFGKSRESGVPDAHSLKTPSPIDQERRVGLDSEMARFLRDGACRR
jgi:hypothetical protein